MDTHSTRLADQISKATQVFINQVHDLTRQAVTSTLEAAMGAGPTTAVLSPQRARASVGTRGKGTKRTPEDLEQLSSQFTDFVRAHPGLRIEQINRDLGTSTHDLALPIRKLIASGAISTKGAKRSTTYFAGGQAPKTEKVPKAEKATKKTAKAKKTPKKVAKPKKTAPKKTAKSKKAPKTAETAPEPAA
jgi:hypothetical protein